jgi:hypothetical protein
VSLAKFSMLVASVLVATTLAVAIGVSGRADAGLLLVAATTGSLLAGVNAVVAYALVLWSRERTTTVFMRAILGGMSARMLVLIGATALALRVFGLPQSAFVPSLLGHFAVFLALELAAAHRSVRQAVR